MKKTISILIAVILIIGMISGCSNGNEAADATASPAPQKTDAPISNTDFEETATPEPLNSSVATWEDDTFISEWGKFEIQMPEDWYKVTDEEIRLVQNIGEEMMVGTGEFTEEDLENTNYVYPMMISKYPLSGLVEGFNTNLIVVFEKLNALSVLSVNGESYLEIVKSQYEGMNIGYDFPGKIESIKLDGEKYFTMTAEHKESGLRQVMVCKKHKGFMIFMVVSASMNDQDEIDMILDSIKQH